MRADIWVNWRGGKIYKAKCSQCKWNYPKEDDWKEDLVENLMRMETQNDNIRNA